MSSTHLIDSLEFDVSFACRDDAASAQSTLSPLVRERLLRVISEVFDNTDSTSGIQSFDQIIIDLGVVSDIAQVYVMESRLRTQLLEVLGKPAQAFVATELISTKITNASLKEVSSGHDSVESARSLEVLLHYLTHGMLPWNAGAHGTTNTVALFESLKTLTARELRKFFMRVIRIPNAAERFAQHSPLELLEEMLSRLLGLPPSSAARAIRHLGGNADGGPAKVFLIESLLCRMVPSGGPAAQEHSRVVRAVADDFRRRAVSCDAKCVREVIHLLLDDLGVDTIDNVEGDLGSISESKRVEQFRQYRDRTSVCDRGPLQPNQPNGTSDLMVQDEHFTAARIPTIANEELSSVEVASACDQAELEPFAIPYEFFERLVQYLTGPAPPDEHTFDLNEAIEYLEIAAPWLLRHVFSMLRSVATTAVQLSHRLEHGEPELLFRALLTLQDSKSARVGADTLVPRLGLRARAQVPAAVDRHFSEALVELLQGRVDNLLSLTATSPHESQNRRHSDSRVENEPRHDRSSLMSLLQAGDRWDDFPEAMMSMSDRTEISHELTDVRSERVLPVKRRDGATGVGRIDERAGYARKLELDELRVTQPEAYREAFETLPEAARVSYLAGRGDGFDPLILAYAEMIAGAVAEATDMSIAMHRRNMFCELDELLTGDFARYSATHCAVQLLDRLLEAQGAIGDGNLRASVVRRLLAQHRHLDEIAFRQLLKALATDSPRGHSQLSEPALTISTARPKERPAGDISIDNAGLVIAAAYIPRLLETLGLMKCGKFTAPDAAHRGAQLVELLANREYPVPEFRLVLNKLLCGLPTGAVLSPVVGPCAEEIRIADSLLQGIISNWQALGNTSIEALQSNFLCRPGRLSHDEHGWLLRVKPGPYDMLLDRLPWSISTIRSSWMPEPIRVIWR